jgi:two-component system sensor histidine kinase VicK
MYLTWWSGLRDNCVSPRHMPSTPLLYLAERSNELFFIYDLIQKQFTYMNPTCISFFGLKDHNIKAKELLKSVHPEDQEYVLSQFKICIDGQMVVDAECRIRRGKYERWLSITPFVSTENGEHLLIGQAEDITANKENSEILNKHNNKKNSILNILAHDLAGPIGTVQNLSVLLARETAHLNSPQISRYISIISKISKTNISLIQDFLNQEFLESSNVKLLKTRVELVKKIKMLTQEYLDTQSELKIQFICDANKESIYVEIDEDKFMQVINNLISNALKFTPDGGTIRLNMEENENDIVVSVADSGIGIPQQYHTTLFDKFSDARRNGLKGEHSTGLGMSIIKNIVDWHHGEIWFNSKENIGTTFYIRLQKIIEEPV